jgi:hypothetical protein
LVKSRKFKPSERRELKPYLQYIFDPVASPDEYLKKLAIRLFLQGQDALALISAQVDFTAAERACNQARAWLGDIRGARRKDAFTIKKERKRALNINHFTFENFHDIMGYSSNRNLHMITMSIYCLVEVWVDDDEVEKEYFVNFSDHRIKVWLTRLMVWALMNKREIVIRPATEQDASTMKMFVPKDKERVGADQTATL